MPYVMHPLGVATASPVKPGDFGLSINQGKVSVSRQTYEICRQLNVNTAEGLLNLAHNLPSSVAQEFGWTIQEVDLASSLAGQQLAGIVAPEYLSRQTYPRMPMGAFPPPDNADKID